MSGAVRVFGLDPQKEEVAVKSRLAYVPDAVAFYPWMTVRDTLDYFASFRANWNQDIETEILQARDIGTAIVEEAIESKADLIIVGVPYRADFGEFVDHEMEV